MNMATYVPINSELLSDLVDLAEAHVKRVEAQRANRATRRAKQLCRATVEQAKELLADYAPLSSIILLGLALGGCMQATANWTKPGASTSDIERAQLECKFEAAKSDVTFTQTTWQTELQQMSIIDACLRAKGYVR
jgi:cytochrome c-type biogenesis protein CcmH/NrfG